MNDPTLPPPPAEGSDAAHVRYSALLHEVDHRVKNNLQLIASLLVLQCRRESNAVVRSALSDMLSRVNAVAVVHRRLFQDNPLSFDVAAFLQDLVDDRAPGGLVTVNLELVRAEVPTAMAAPLALVTNELLANSLRHGFPDDRRGAVLVRLIRNDDHLRIEIIDNGVGVPEDLVDGFGLTIVRLLSRQLKAQFEMSPATPGVRASLTLPLESRA